MRGRKPDLNNVAQHPAAAEYDRESVAARQAAEEKSRFLRPHGLGEKVRRVWDRVAPELVLLGRLKPHYVDALEEYCRIVVRLREARNYLDDESWTYVTKGRHGSQEKSRPEVAQLNDDWRKWRSLVGEFGMAPAADRGLTNGQSDIFDAFDDF